MTTRTATGTGGTTANLTYDGQDHLVRWNDTNTTSNEEWYLYDASGQRVLRRSQQGGASNTTLTVYAFGLEEHQYGYTGSGSSATNTGNTYYYSLGGHLIGTSNGTSTSFLLTDALGSVVSSLSNTANSASVNGNQTYGPYGNQAYSKGTVGTNKGYTGQYNDALTQLDYYGARYYDPFVGNFLSADTVQGNGAGMNPYNYVGSNPETWIDPTGEMYAPPPGSQPQGNPPPPPPATSVGSAPSTCQNTELCIAAVKFLVGFTKFGFEARFGNRPGAISAALSAVSTYVPAFAGDDSRFISNAGKWITNGQKYFSDNFSGKDYEGFVHGSPFNDGALHLISGLLGDALNFLAAAYDIADLNANAHSKHPNIFSMGSDIAGLLAIGIYYGTKIAKRLFDKDVDENVTLSALWGLSIGGAVIQALSYMPNINNSNGSGEDNHNRDRRGSGGGGLPPLPPITPPTIPNFQEPIGGEPGYITPPGTLIG